MSVYGMPLALLVVALLLTVVGHVAIEQQRKQLGMGLALAAALFLWMAFAKLSADLGMRPYNLAVFWPLVLVLGYLICGSGTRAIALLLLLVSGVMLIWYALNPEAAPAIPLTVMAVGAVVSQLLPMLGGMLGGRLCDALETRAFRQMAAAAPAPASPAGTPPAAPTDQPDWQRVLRTVVLGALALVLVTVALYGLLVLYMWCCRLAARWYWADPKVLGHVSPTGATFWAFGSVCLIVGLAMDATAGTGVRRMERSNLAAALLVGALVGIGIGVNFQLRAITTPATNLEVQLEAEAAKLQTPPPVAKPAKSAKPVTKRVVKPITRPAPPHTAQPTNRVQPASPRQGKRIPIWVLLLSLAVIIVMVRVLKKRGQIS